MKKILSIITVFSLILATLLSTSSCSEDKNKTECVAGLQFTIPKYMSKKVASDYGVYQNDDDGTRFCVYYYAEEKISEDIGESATVKAYCDWYVMKNKISLTSENYDADKNLTVVEYLTVADEAERYCYDYIIRDGNTLYHVSMSCDSDLKSDYVKTFKKWTKSFKITDELLHYSENGLNFSLPSYMETINVNYADLCFANSGDDTQFFIYFYSSEALLTDLYMDMDSTVKEYADWFVNLNGYTNVEENYDEENKKIVLKYVYEDESTFYCDTILRNEYSLIHVTMCCQERNRAIYEPVFDEWITYLSLVY
ncbi:MAG: hypothetical protein E7612_05220 [Ruminococcaceae bacterium]|nr:hypothetical protein [Oscillospiraceae bacterium]